MLRIGMVAGEVSGDLLGAGLINALRQLDSRIVVEGIGGESMLAAGMTCLYPAEKLAVMGITEVLGRYRELWQIRNRLCQHFISHPPDVFIGIDAPDFNLGLEKKLRRSGIGTIHYVSPSVWAWREYRIRNIKRSVNMMLTLFPFESDYYSAKALPNQYVGHPLADKLNTGQPMSSAREKLGVPMGKTVVAVLPGSRMSEIHALAEILLRVSAKIAARNQAIYLISGLANEATCDEFKRIHERIVPQLNINLHVGKTHDVLAAADVVLLASGTATLETMLLNKPMVVTYRLSWLTYILVRMLARSPYAALPNILANRFIVPECLQADCGVLTIDATLQQLLDSPQQQSDMKQEFQRLSSKLAINANMNAAHAVMEFIHARQNAD